MNKRVIELAKIAHREHWRVGSDVGAGDKHAAKVTKHWQEAVLRELPHFRYEFPIECGCGEKIDLYDPDQRVAYELKVSPNNTHFEFFRDIFKVLVRNKGHSEKIKTFVFLANGKGYSRLAKGLGKAALDLSSELGVKLMIEEV